MSDIRQPVGGLAIAGGAGLSFYGFNRIADGFQDTRQARADTSTVKRLATSNAVNTARGRVNPMVANDLQNTALAADNSMRSGVRNLSKGLGGLLTGVTAIAMGVALVEA